jgi:hypothetical protein
MPSCRQTYALQIFNNISRSELLSGIMCFIIMLLIFFWLQKLRMQDTIRRYRTTCLREKGREPLLEPYNVVLSRYEEKPVE